MSGSELNSSSSSGNGGGGRLRTVLVGAGSLGRRFLERLADSDGPLDLVGVVTAHHGRLVKKEGVDPRAALERLTSSELGQEGPEDFRNILELARPDLVVECIPQNIRSGEPALEYMRMALDGAVHVVTSNKAPVALGYRDLRHRGARTGAKFRFEATVLDGLPVFRFIEQLKPVGIRKVRGILNTTSSIVLESVQLGSTRSRGLARAQARGIAEADSILDVDGWDAAAKITLLANVWMGGALRVVDVSRTGTQALKDADLVQAAQDQLRYRLVAEAVKDEQGGVTAKVGPVALAPQDPLYGVRASKGAVSVETDSGQAFTLVQETSGLDDAAQGLWADCLAVLDGRPQL